VAGKRRYQDEQFPWNLPPLLRLCFLSAGVFVVVGIFGGLLEGEYALGCTATAVGVGMYYVSLRYWWEHRKD
jgi:hypothetical protein